MAWAQTRCPNLDAAPDAAERGQAAALHPRERFGWHPGGPVRPHARGAAALQRAVVEILRRRLPPRLLNRTLAQEIPGAAGASQPRRSRACLLASVQLTRVHASQRTTPLLAPDTLICSVGTEIYRRGEQGGVADEKWSDVLEQGWQRDALLSAACCARGLTLQEPSEQRRHKISLRSRVPGGCAGADAAVEDLRTRLDATGAPYDLISSSGCLDVDILPRGANKGAALHFILQEQAEHALAGCGTQPLSQAEALRACAECTLVAGDSGNDTQLLATEHVRAVVVANAQPELLAWARDAGPSPRVFVATQRCADGVIEAMKHFGFMLQDARADAEDGAAAA